MSVVASWTFILIIILVCSIIAGVLGIIGMIFSIIGLTRPGKKPLAIIGLILSLFAIGTAAYFIIRISIGGSILANTLYYYY